ncbi:MAG: hypothetical protein A2341_23105 [Deltaproteobacteria bacterium RIFOXYB12_FULL_58_9]|nr:MAG: hypothetical protein A2341_23105 [Deltaproteobacteria bacterium RIFOXYB12_FULL_58_9]
MTDYRLHDPNRGVIGPISIETVQDLVNAGVVHDAMWVSRDGGPFLPVAAFSEISPQPANESSTEPKPTYSGDLGKNTFFKVFYRFHITHATGLLAIQATTHHKRIYLIHGQPVYVNSSLPEEKLGEYLVRKGRIERDELNVALGSMHTDDNRLGYTLIRLGLLDPPELFDALRAQQTERLVDLCTWEAGRYLYYEGITFDGEVLNLQLHVPELVIQAARGLPLDRLETRMAPHLDAYAVPTSGQVASSESLRLTAFERRVANSIDGKRTVRQIAGNLKADQRRAAMMVLYLLWEIDALSFNPSPPTA